MKQESKVASDRPTSAKARAGVLLALVAASATGGCVDLNTFAYRITGGRYEDPYEEEKALERQREQDAWLKEHIQNQSLVEESGSEDRELPDPQNPQPDPQDPPVDPQNPPL